MSHFTLRASGEELSAWGAAAKDAGLTLEAWMRSRLNRAVGLGYRGGVAGGVAPTKFGPTPASRQTLEDSAPNPDALARHPIIRKP